MSMELIQNTEAIRILVGALSNLNEAIAERDKCYSECEYSPGYHCRNEDNEVDRRAGALHAALNMIIDERLQSILANKGAK